MVKGAGKPIDFYKKPFNARDRRRMQDPGGKIRQAEMEMGNSGVRLADEFPEMGGVGPQTLGGTPVGLHVYVENVDAMYAQALAAGAKQDRPLTNQFYGDRSGSIIDPFGHKWNLGQHIEDVSPTEMDRRMQEM